MKNTGTWDSDLVLFFMFAFLLPVFISILANVFRSFRPLTHCQDVSPDVVRSDIMIEDDNMAMTAMRAELESIKKQLSKPKPKTKKKKSKKYDKNKTIMQEVVIALNKLGIQKSRANSIVKELCKEKTYKSSEDLLKDAIVYIG